MLYYVILCYMMLYDVIWCYMMLYDVILCYIMLYYVILCYMMLYDVIWCYMMLYDVILCYMMLYDVIWCYIMLYFLILAPPLPVCPLLPLYLCVLVSACCVFCSFSHVYSIFLPDHVCSLFASPSALALLWHLLRCGVRAWRNLQGLAKRHGPWPNKLVLISC